MPQKAKSPRVVSQIVKKIHAAKQSILDGTATVPDLLDDFDDIEKLARSIDARRAELDPTLGGKVR